MWECLKCLYFDEDKDIQYVACQNHIISTEEYDKHFKRKRCGCRGFCESVFCFACGNKVSMHDAINLQDGYMCAECVKSVIQSIFINRGLK
jgi:hypothetical protein